MLPFGLVLSLLACPDNTLLIVADDLGVESVGVYGEGPAESQPPTPHLDALAADGLTPAAIEKDAARSYQRLTTAPLLSLLCLSMADMDTYPDPTRQQNEWIMAVQSVALAGQNLLLAAHALGLGACWNCAPLFAQDIVRQTLQLPADWQPQALISAGYPAETRQKTRHPLTQVTRYF